MSGPQLVLAHASKVVDAGPAGRHDLARAAGAVLGVLGDTWRPRLLETRSSPCWPERFYTPAFWMQKQAVYETLKFAIGLELAYRALSAFPGTWRTARVVFPCLLAITTLLLMLGHATRELRNRVDLAAQHLGRVACGPSQGPL